MKPIGCSWDELPLFVSVEDAAKLAGVSPDEIRRLVHKPHNPLSHHVVGRTVKVNVRLMPDYMAGICLK